ncbi:hypothetical protein COCCADRAFT_30578 [Bipolaris zeicola 26-R-13]|uniref:Heterokaryon incompatibility domain-containing protein n=1 Tax=Cochliobolus carbonum (strain 26-R-13) TaxID=930089 RepID=W6XS10_COCC2|nr:uncharacterized protein COCCADRAFT_30578 [Bipolaris zeicola 26-R-13]EUC28100.1 hypothetical protein COCCADRAFT_30578 [Bipolaris zeicola 26-R-13]
MEPLVDHETRGSTIILSVCLNSLKPLTQRHPLPILSIASSATPGRFRLIDCDQFLYHHSLTVHEFCEFPVPETAYAAISYIWRGNSVDESLVGARFSIAGAEDGDPVGVEVLRHACTAALLHNIYEGCAVCFIFPGGIQRLVCLDEPTAWIHRAWTLQEALAPPCVEVVYRWTLGRGMYVGLYRGDIHELIPGESAITPLRALLGLNIFPEVTFIGSKDPIPFRTTIFGLPTGSTPPYWPEHRTEIVISMFQNALPHGDGPTFNQRAPAIWRSMLFRTSSRPVDMIFSIMGLFGVTLDPRAFEPDDRLDATVALMRAILKRPGGRASWLGVAPYLPPHPRLSTIPNFPHTSVDGKVELELDFAPEIGERSQNQPLDQVLSQQRLSVLDTRSISMPTGSVDEAGYLCISRPVFPGLTLGKSVNYLLADLILTLWQDEPGLMKKNEQRKKEDNGIILNWYYRCLEFVDLDVIWIFEATHSTGISWARPC